jgi:aryl-alcohol dehydrogenase-like predicted oxidoreductase
VEYRQLGASGLRVSAFSFGTMTFAGVGQTKGEVARRQVDLCLEAGVNLFDTADVYSSGESEEVLAQALGDRRQQVLIATKGYGRMGPGQNDMGASRRHIIAACEASLKRLNTDYIDLYQIHSQDSLTPVEETMRALDDLVTSGKVRYIGSSNYAGWWKMRSLAASDRFALERFVAQQIQYSLLYRDAEDELLPLGLAEGVGALIWSPLANGYLTGKFKGDGADAATRLKGAWLEGLDNERGRAVVASLEEIAAAHPGASPAQVALNWVVRKPGVSSIIIGARTDEQLSDNLAAATWSLSDEEIARLDKVSALPKRYPYSHHAQYPERNPSPGLLPPLF